MNPNLDIALNLPPVLEEDIAAEEARRAARRKEIHDLRAERMMEDANSLPIKAELRNWQVQHFPGKDYIAIWGYVYDDVTGKFRDGEWIRTSMIAKIEDGIAVTLNSAYRLVGTEAKVDAHVN
ncbi:hypothetical protein vBRpoSV10_70 [Ruegeria phage vB_RpoS-V10]|nr:hypothetical protein DSS3P8_070 [Roseobacter phage DSS3P8]AWY09192.1 hypothetical protein vBRpoSV10_70 [Ruegeria phage vB_RpoS-V10]